MNKNWIIIVLIAVIILQAYFLFTTKPTISDSGEYVERIDSLESEIQSLVLKRDSVVERIDSIYIEIEKNDSKHEETINTVINNTVSEDYDFFRNYLASNRARLDSLYNIGGAEIHKHNLCRTPEVVK